MLPCDYYDYTLIEGAGNFLPLGVFNISLNEYTDPATTFETSNLSIANNIINKIYGRTSVNFKKLIQGGGGAFNGNFTVKQGSAIKCDANIYNTLAPLLVTGNLDTTTKKVSITIKGKTFF